MYMVVNNFKGYLGFSGKIFVKGTEENLVYFIKDIYGVKKVQFIEDYARVDTIEISDKSTKASMFEKCGGGFILIKNSDGEYSLNINIGSFHEDSNHRSDFFYKLVSLSMKHDVRIKGFVFEDFYSTLHKFSVDKGRNIKTSSFGYDEIEELI